MFIRNIVLGAIALTTVAAPAAAAVYLPMGPQANVLLSTVTGGGWTQCYAATMASPFGNSAATTLAPCTGSRLLLAGRATGSSTLLVLAQALKIDVLFDTGTGDGSTTHLANGTNWYNADQWSLGFAEAGQNVSKSSCDIANGGLRLCIHTIDFTGGYRINDIAGLNNSDDYEKLAFSSNGTVPEPAAWALMIAGFGMVGAAARRRRAGFVAA